MEIVSITCGLQLFGVIICWINYFKVKKIEKQILYYHEKKSFQDIYKMGGMWGILTAVINWCIGLIFYICKEVYKEIVFVIIEKAFIIAISGMMMAIIVYMITEIKHLSPEDTIGRKIINSNNKELEEKACRFYKSEFGIGMCMGIILLIQLAYVDKLALIIVLVIAVSVYFLGMADMLQYEGYNTLEFAKNYKKKTMLEKIFIPNISKCLQSEEYRKNRKQILFENRCNIRKSLKYIWGK